MTDTCFVKRIGQEDLRSVLSIGSHLFCEEDHAEGSGGKKLLPHPHWGAESGNITPRRGIDLAVPIYLYSTCLFSFVEKHHGWKEVNHLSFRATSLNFKATTQDS